MFSRTVKTIVSKLFATRSRSSNGRRRNRQFPAAAEVLEERVLLAAGDWITEGNGSFQVGANWAGGAVPTTGTQATFNKKVGTGYTVTFAANATSKLTVTADANPKFDLNGKTYNVEQLIVGQDDGKSPTLQLNAGGTLKAPGGTIDHSGTLELISGGNSEFNATSTLTVGDAKAGTMIVDKGGRVDATGELIVGKKKGSNGTVRVRNTDAKYFGTKNVVVGQEGIGKLEVLNGAHFDTATAYLQIGQSDALETKGTVLVQGKDPATGGTLPATITTDRLLLWGNKADLLIKEHGKVVVSKFLVSGAQGTTVVGGVEDLDNRIEVIGQDAELFVPNGFMQIAHGFFLVGNKGQVVSKSGIVMRNHQHTSGALARVDDSGSKWQITEDLWIGEGGQVAVSTEAMIDAGGPIRVMEGDLHIHDKGVVNSVGADVGGRFTTRAYVDVIDTGSVWNVKGNLRIGGANKETHKVTTKDGGKVKVGGQTIGGKVIEVGAVDGGDGQLIVQGIGSSAEALFGGSMIVGNGQDSGSLEVWDGGEAVTNTFTHNDFGSIVGDSVVAADTITSTGSLAYILPGDVGSIATLTFDTPIWDATAGVTYSTELAGPGVSDELYVTGNAALGGTLDVNLLGYTPVEGDLFDVLVAGEDIAGEFGSYNLPALSAGLTWQVNYLLDAAGPDIVELEVVAGDTPVADGDSYSVLHNQTLDTFNDGFPSLLANDYDPDGDPLTAHIVAYPANGTLTWFDENTGDFVYEAPVDFVGTDYFSYYASDGTDDSYVTLVTIDVTNNAPTAGDDFYFIDHDTQLTVSTPGVLSNDFEIDPGDVLQAVVLELPANGTLTDGAGTPLSVGSVFEGGFQYTPDPGTTGFDYFTYAADDGYEQSPATVTIDVYNDIPTAGDDFYSTDHDTTLNETPPECWRTTSTWTRSKPISSTTCRTAA